MTAKIIEVFYICPRCMEPAEEPTPCPRCGGDRITCRPGAADDPSRRPLIGPADEVRSHAPVWWLQATGVLDNRYGDRMERS